MKAHIFSAGLTLGLVVLVWQVWVQAGHAAGWAGFEDIEIVVQLAAVFGVLALAETIISRVRRTWPC